MAVDEVRGPAKFANRFNSTFAEEDHPVLVVIEKLSTLVFKDKFSFEKFLGLISPRTFPFAFFCEAKRGGLARPSI